VVGVIEHDRIRSKLYQGPASPSATPGPASATGFGALRGFMYTDQTKLMMNKKKDAPGRRR